MSRPDLHITRSRVRSLFFKRMAGNDFYLPILRHRSNVSPSTLATSFSRLYLPRVNGACQGKHRNNRRDWDAQGRQGDVAISPRRVGPVVLVVSGSILPALDVNLGELPVQFLAWPKDHIQRCLSALLGGQVCHVAATQVGLHPLETIISVFCAVSLPERKRKEKSMYVRQDRVPRM